MRALSRTSLNRLKSSLMGREREGGGGGYGGRGWWWGGGVCKVGGYQCVNFLPEFCSVT